MCSNLFLWGFVIPFMICLIDDHFYLLSFRLLSGLVLHILIFLLVLTAFISLNGTILIWSRNLHVTSQRAWPKQCRLFRPSSQINAPVYSLRLLNLRNVPGTCAHLCLGHPDQQRQEIVACVEDPYSNIADGQLFGKLKAQTCLLKEKTFKSKQSVRNLNESLIYL